MSNLADLVQARNRNGLYVWIAIWAVQVINVFLLHIVPRTQWQSVVSAAIIGVGPFIVYHYWKQARKANSSIAGEVSGRRTVEERLDELERLKRREMVTPEEYAAKRQEILKEL